LFTPNRAAGEDENASRSGTCGAVPVRTVCPAGQLHRAGQTSAGTKKG